MYRAICLRAAKFRHLVRVEARAADWRSFMHASAVGALFAAVGAADLAGLSSQLTALRFSFAALSIGVAMAMENTDGEAGMALPVGPGSRLVARLISVSAAYVFSITLVLMLGHAPTLLTGRLIIEAVTLVTIAVLAASLGIRLWTRHYSVWAAMALAAVFLVSWLSPARINLWWDGVGSEPAHYPWILTGLMCALGTVFLASRASLLELRTARRIADRVVPKRFCARQREGALLRRIRPPNAQSGSTRCLRSD